MTTKSQIQDGTSISNDTNSKLSSSSSAIRTLLMNPSPADSGSSLSEAETRHSRQPLHPSTTTTNIPSTDISNSNKRIEPNRSGPDINKALLLTEDIRRGEKLLGESFSTLKLSVPGPNPFPTTMPTPMPGTVTPRPNPNVPSTTTTPDNSLPAPTA
jgi:hypothetical protein